MTSIALLFGVVALVFGLIGISRARHRTPLAWTAVALGFAAGVVALLLIVFVPPS